ncbi:MAG: glycoside hydrolase family 13 protein [Halanaerobiales bacterium]|jgi:cyclomaltodextrinase
MNKAAVFHMAGMNYAYPVDMNTLVLRLRAARNDLKDVKVIYGSRYPRDGRAPYKVKDMELCGRDDLYDYFTATIEMDDNRFRYYFYLNDGEEEVWFSEKGFSTIRPESSYGYGVYFQYPVITEGNIFSVPEWVQDAVFYQIFPDRFYNGNQDNDPAGVKPWGGKPESDSFFGGDLEGIIEKLDYLKDLGINALYLTPIFKSTSNHKYNTDDYYQIDPAFGDKKILKKLVEEAHQRGIRIILDAVFNHSGFYFFAFQDVLEKGKDSKYWDWFFIEGYPVKTTPPVNYHTFANDVVDMPKLNTSNPEVQEYLLDVVRYWMEEVDIDGWRLDVANEVDRNFWRKFRETVKGIKKDAYIVGEIWHNSEVWLQGDQFDAIMNYPLAMAILDFLAQRSIGPTEFNNRLVRNWMLYQDRVNYSMLNLINSHDTRRLLNYFSGDKESMKLAVLFQFTYPGAPMIYYGDEVGMKGGDDPDCRRCMIWDEEKQDRELYAYYKKLIGLRHKFQSLRRGTYRPIIIDEIKNSFGFIRSHEEEYTVVILNNSHVPQEYVLEGELLVDKGEIKDYLNGQSFRLKDSRYRIEVPAYGGVILN